MLQVEVDEEFELVTSGTCVCDRLLVSVACVDAISPMNYALPTRTGTAAFLIIAFLKSTQNHVHVL